MIDNAILARALADIRDAVARIRAVLPAREDELVADRDAREIVVLNLYVALQQCLSLATHWLADAGLQVSASHRETLHKLAEQEVLTPELAARLGAAAGLRNLIAHRYGILDWKRIHEIASAELDDLLDFCQQLARKAGAGEA